jgi:phosphatidylglycerophosphate synthase
MDHFLDFLFLCSLCFAGYLILPPGLSGWIFALLIILLSFLVVTFLAFSCTNQFEIYHLNLGPTEVRALVIIVNCLLILFGLERLKITLPVVCLVLTILLIIYAYKMSAKIWRLDMNAKNLS